MMYYRSEAIQVEKLKIAAQNDLFQLFTPLLGKYQAPGRRQTTSLPFCLFDDGLGQGCSGFVPDQDFHVVVTLSSMFARNGRYGITLKIKAFMQFCRFGFRIGRQTVGLLDSIFNRHSDAIECMSFLVSEFALLRQTFPLFVANVGSVENDLVAGSANSHCAMSLQGRALSGLWSDMGSTHL